MNFFIFTTKAVGNLRVKRVKGTVLRRFFSSFAYVCFLNLLALNLISLFTDPLFSLQSPSSARDKKLNRGGFIDRQRKEVVVGEEENFSFSRSFSCARSPMFSERTKRKRTDNDCVQASKQLSVLFNLQNHIFHGAT